MEVELSSWNGHHWAMYDWTPERKIKSVWMCACVCVCVCVYLQREHDACFGLMGCPLCGLDP